MEILPLLTNICSEDVDLRITSNFLVDKVLGVLRNGGIPKTLGFNSEMDYFRMICSILIWLASLERIMMNDKTVYLEVIVIALYYAKSHFFHADNYTRSVVYP